MMNCVINGPIVNIASKQERIMLLELCHLVQSLKKRLESAQLTNKLRVTQQATERSWA